MGIRGVAHELAPSSNSLKPCKVTGIPVETSGTNGLRLTRRAGP
jgi:hypothetical protein